MKDENDIHTAIKKLTPTYISCRDYGHSWTPLDARILPRKAGYEQVLRCNRCHTERFRLVGKWGDVIKGSYQYPEGYSMAGMGRLTAEDRGQLRIASIMDVARHS